MNGRRSRWIRRNLTPRGLSTARAYAMRSAERLCPSNHRDLTGCCPTCGAQR